jgi:hypothetical protein
MGTTNEAYGILKDKDFNHTLQALKRIGMIRGTINKTDFYPETLLALKTVQS